MGEHKANLKWHDGHFDDQQTTHHIGLNIFDMIFLALSYFGHVVKKEIQILC